MILETLLFGLILGLIFYEVFGIAPAGIITPGYFALFFNQPIRILITFVIALLVWLILEFLQKYLILYGKRRFLVAIILGFLIKLVFENFLQPINISGIELISIGYLIPGLMANEFVKQKIFRTILVTAIVTIMCHYFVLLIK